VQWKYSNEKKFGCSPRFLEVRQPWGETKHFSRQNLFRSDQFVSNGAGLYDNFFGAFLFFFFFFFCRSFFCNIIYDLDKNRYFREMLRFVKIRCQRVWKNLEARPFVRNIKSLRNEEYLFISGKKILPLCSVRHGNQLGSFVRLINICR
jgi:hypothetical protein